MKYIHVFHLLEAIAEAMFKIIPDNFVEPEEFSST
jgi:hypothetical protein